SPDGKRVVYTDHRGTALKNTQQQAYDIVAADVAGGAPRVLVPKALLEYSITLSFAPNGERIAYVTGGHVVERRRADVGPVAGGAPRQGSVGDHPSFADSYRAPLWDERGENLYVLGRGELWRVPVADSGDAKLVAKIPGRTITQLIAPGNNVGRLFAAPGA